jgi:hypothetical protein
MQVLQKVTAHPSISLSLETSFKSVLLDFSYYEQKYTLHPYHDSVYNMWYQHYSYKREWGLLCNVSSDVLWNIKCTEDLV